MTINEAIMEIQGKSAGIAGRGAVKYAQEQLFEGEKVFAAASANIRSRHGNYPGIIVFTDQRLFVAGGLPGMRRAISLPLKELRSCKDMRSPLSYTVSVSSKTDSFNAVLSPQAGKNFSQYISALKNAFTGRYSEVLEKP